MFGARKSGGMEGEGQVVGIISFLLFGIGRKIVVKRLSLVGMRLTHSLGSNPVP